jgi:predicted membrane protein (TIGR00267 family)
MEKYLNKNLIHNQNPNIISVLREIVFGVEDGIISTLGVLIGIAAGTNERFVVIISGIVVIVVESISMGVGSYLSAKSVREADENKLKEEEMEIREFSEKEKRELFEMYIRDGWSEDLANRMVLESSKNKKLFLMEMAHRELHVHPEKLENPLRGGMIMFLSYVVGGTIPLLPYFFLPISSAILFSIALASLGLFILGSITTKFTKRHWFKAGVEIVFIAGLAAAVGYLVGLLANHLFKG